jgi:hypothetical protein
LRSSGPPEPASQAFFIDRDLGTRTFPNVLRAAGIAVVLHDDVYPATQKVSDHEWLRYTAEQGLVAVSHDAKIRYTSASRDDILRFGARLLILKGKASATTLAENFVRTYPAIERFLARHSPPFIARVYRHPHAPQRPGRIELWLSR